MSKTTNKELSIKKSLSEFIKKIMTSTANKKNYKAFQDTVKNLHPKSCIVKFGWKSGTAINFTLAYEKGGNGEPYNEFIEGIKDKKKAYYFIVGLEPKIFHFNPITVANIDNYLILMFKLKRNG